MINYLQHLPPQIVNSVVIIFLSSLAFSAFSENLYNEENDDEFQIEYILFLHDISYDNEKAEHNRKYEWNENSPYTHLISGFAPLSAYHYPVLGQEQMVLQQALDNLSKSRETQVVSHAAWRQVIPSESTSPPVPINSLVKIKSEQPFLLESRIEGKLTFKRSRYTHVEAELYFSDYYFYPKASLIPWILESESNNLPLMQMLIPYSNHELSEYFYDYASIPGNIHLFDQSRRLKYGEIHYLDHPSMGLIVTINKVEAEPEL